MAKRRNPTAEYYRINDTTKLSLVQRSNGRWIVYRLQEGEKSRQLRGFRSDEHERAVQYCRDKQKAASTIKVRQKRTKVTLVEDNTNRPTLVEKLAGMQVYLLTLSKRVERLERELGIGESR